MTSCIVGWSHIPFGKSEVDVEAMIVNVAAEALADAGVEPSDVAEIVLGHFNAGFVPQDFTASLVLQAAERLRFLRPSSCGQSMGLHTREHAGTNPGARTCPSTASIPARRSRPRP